jgi:hypothetical protein
MGPARGTMLYRCCKPVSGVLPPQGPFKPLHPGPLDTTGRFQVLCPRPDLSLLMISYTYALIAPRESQTNFQSSSAGSGYGLSGNSTTFSLHGYAENIAKRLRCCFGVWPDLWVPRWYNLDKRSKSRLQRDLVQNLIPGSRFEMKSESLPTAGAR